MIKGNRQDVFNLPYLPTLDEGLSQYKMIIPEYDDTYTQCRSKTKSIAPLIKST